MSTASSHPKAPAFALPALGARRLFLLGGIALILCGMIFGDIFAVFVLHQNASHVAASLAEAAHAAVQGDASRATGSFLSVGAFLENRGTKVDTHVHMIGFGYLALVLAVIEPWIALSAAAKRRVAWICLGGSWLLPIGVFLIHYVGLTGSPFASIGWASLFADFGGLLVIVALGACLLGLLRQLRSPLLGTRQEAWTVSRSACTRLLFTGGVLLVLLGFLSGASYAALDLDRHEAQDLETLSDMASSAASGNAPAVDRALDAYGGLQGDKAVKIAAHAHAIEFGVLAMLLGFFQPFVALSEPWRLRWAACLLAGSFLLPLCVFLELRYGLLAGGLADIGGLLVILALLAMGIGIVRYTGHLDGPSAQAGT